MYYLMPPIVLSCFIFFIVESGVSVPIVLVFALWKAEYLKQEQVLGPSSAH